MDLTPPPLLGSALHLVSRGYLAESTLFFLVSCVLTVTTLGTRRFFPLLNLAVIVPGFLLQIAFLVSRGEWRGRCPLTNLFEVIAFLSWALVLFYLIVGSTYRLSPLGVLTAPLVFFLQVFALGAPLDQPGQRAGAVNPWIETHAAFSILAFGAFALAGLAGGMYLWQERQLKTHRVRALFFQLPPIADLGKLNTRLLVVGFVLLTVGLAAGVGMGAPSTWPHLAWAVVVWLLYAFLVQARWGAWKLPPRRVASLSVVAFALALLTLSGLSFVAA